MTRNVSQDCCAVSVSKASLDCWRLVFSLFFFLFLSSSSSSKQSLSRYTLCVYHYVCIVQRFEPQGKRFKRKEKLHYMACNMPYIVLKIKQLKRPRMTTAYYAHRNLLYGTLCHISHPQKWTSKKEKKKENGASVCSFRDLDTNSVRVRACVRACVCVCV